MMKPGTAFEPAYRLMAECCRTERRCKNLDVEDVAEYWHIRQCGIQNTLLVLTGYWPIALVDDRTIIVCHGTYKQTFDI